MDHFWGVRSKRLVEGMAVQENDEVVSFSVKNGHASIQTRRDETLKYIQAQFGSFPGVKVTLKNAVEVERQKNITAQQRADKFRERTKKRRQDDTDLGPEKA